MKSNSQEALLLRIYIDEGDHHGHRPLYEWILNQAMKQDLAGATVLRGTAGFGADRHPHSARILSIANALPLVLEIVDAEEKIEAFLPILDEVLSEGLVTTERVNARMYGRNRADSS